MEISHELKKIFAFRKKSNILKTRESGKVEFKLSFNWNDRERIARSMAAFANTKGGFIIFGVKNHPHAVIGLKRDNFDRIDEAVITGYLNSLFSPEINYEKISIVEHGNTLGILAVQESLNKPVISIKTSRDIKEAEIYYRYHGQSSRIKYPELSAIIQEAKDNVASSWKHFLKGMAKIDEPSLVADSLKDIEKKQVLKVTFSDDETATKVKIDEQTILKKFPLTHKNLIQILRTRYVNFSPSKQFNELKKRFKQDPNLYRIRTLDPNNPKSAWQGFYSRNVIEKFDKYYILRKK